VCGLLADEVASSAEAPAEEEAGIASTAVSIATVLAVYHRPVHRDASGSRDSSAAVHGSAAVSGDAADGQPHEIYLLEGVRLVSTLLLRSGPDLAEPLVVGCAALPALLLYHSQTMSERHLLAREWASVGLRALVEHSPSAAAELARLKRDLSVERTAAAAEAAATTPDSDIAVVEMAPPALGVDGSACSSGAGALAAQARAGADSTS